MSAPIPAFYDDLAETLAESWRLLARGVADRRSPFHHPTVATIGQDGAPQLRTVILRSCDVSARTLRFHTDARSAKVGEIARDASVSLHFYDPSAKIQLRISGRATLHRDDVVADAAWENARVFSRLVYGITPGPGASINAGADFTLPDDSEHGTAPGRANFTAVTVHAARLEWLYLAAAGHRRAHFAWDGDALRAGWLAP
jgi:pyridoxamine 5'-phosphate oxidase